MVHETRPTVSVVIATFNMAQYLGDAIKSVLGQTFADLDLHIVDDGSTDNTQAVVESFRSDARLHYHHQKNSGQTRAKNVGISRSKGAFIAFCDADDMWLSDKLERQMPLFVSDAVAVVYSRTQRIFADGQCIADANPEPLHSGRITRHLFRSNFIPFGTSVVRRACLEAVGGFDENYRMGIDWDLWLRMSTRYEFRVLDEVTYLYRVWPGQMSNNWRGRYDAAFRIMDKFLKSYPNELAAAHVREAYAHSFTERGRCRTLLDGEYRDGLSDTFIALRYMPSYWPAWKLIGRILVTAAGWRPR